MVYLRSVGNQHFGANHASPMETVKRRTTASDVYTPAAMPAAWVVVVTSDRAARVDREEHGGLRQDQHQRKAADQRAHDHHEILCPPANPADPSPYGTGAEGEHQKNPDESQT